jgi:hypothetical protein
MVPVIAPTPVPSISDDDYTTCSRENLKFFSGEAHDECLNQLFSDVSSQIQSMSATISYLVETFRKHAVVNETNLNEHYERLDRKVDSLTTNITTLADTYEQQKTEVDTKIAVLDANDVAFGGRFSAMVDSFNQYLNDIKYKQPTPAPSQAPTKSRSSWLCNIPNPIFNCK